jgi:hypothetical protein
MLATIVGKSDRAIFARCDAGRVVCAAHDCEFDLRECLPGDVVEIGTLYDDGRLRGTSVAWVERAAYGPWTAGTITTMNHQKGFAFAITDHNENVYLSKKCFSDFAKGRSVMFDTLAIGATVGFELVAAQPSSRGFRITTGD